MKALVTGATGFVGTHLTRALLGRGDSVRILARTAERARSLQAAGAEIRLGDLGDPGTLQGIATGMDVVFHLGSAVAASPAVFERIDVQGTEHILIEAQRAGARRFVYVGTLAGYPLAKQNHGGVIDERTPFDDTGLLGSYARSKTLAEAAVLAAHKRGGIEGVIVRLGLVCGVGANVLPPHVCQRLARDWVILFGDGTVPLPLTHIDNSVDALILAATAQGVGGESFNIVDDDSITQQEYLALLRQAAGGRPRVLRLPTISYYALGLVSEMAATARKREPTTNRYRIRTRLAHVRWDCNKAKHMLQWRPRVRLRDGLTATFREHASARRENR
jgi:nucleoside-diphosphate-sugar epimerase